MIELDLFFEDGTRRRGKFEVPVVMGRASDCGIQVSHWRIARQHLRISRAEDGFHVDDLGSILGTRINGNRITRYGPLKKSDEIIVGPCLLRLAAPLVQKAASAVVCNEGTPHELNRLRQQSEQSPHAIMNQNTGQNHRLQERYAQVQPRGDHQASTQHDTNGDTSGATSGEVQNDTAQQDLRQELRAGLIRAFDLRRNDVATLSESALKGQAQACVSDA